MNLKFLSAPLKRYPFTLAMVLIVMAIGVATATHLDRLNWALRERFGFAPFHLPEGKLVRLVTSAFLTAGGSTFYVSLAMLAVCVGLSEKRAGTWRTLLTFWGVHLATLAFASLVLTIPLHRFDVWPGKLLAAEHDVGPSAGYYGCLGLVCQKQPAQRRRWLFAIVGVILVGRLVWTAVAPHPDSPLGADIAHLIAYPLGILLGKHLRGR
jgi:membrane associated rhomboid family serine protease